MTTFKDQKIFEMQDVNDSTRPPTSNKKPFKKWMYLLLPAMPIIILFIIIYWSIKYSIDCILSCFCDSANIEKPKHLKDLSSDYTRVDVP